MNFKELHEGAEPKLPGAPKGIQIMTPQQFVAKGGMDQEPESKEVDEGYSDISGLMAASHLNKSFIITALTYEDELKKYRVKAQSENVAKEKFMRHHSMSKILSVKEENVDEGYSVIRGIDTERYQPRMGLEGPFGTKSGKVVYYDPSEGKYYDPDSDMYLSHEEYESLNESEGSKNTAPKMGAEELRLARGALKGARDMSRMFPDTFRDKDGVLKSKNTKKPSVAESFNSKINESKDPKDILWQKAKERMDRIEQEELINRTGLKKVGSTTIRPTGATSAAAQGRNIEKDWVNKVKGIKEGQRESEAITNWAVNVIKQNKTNKEPFAYIAAIKHLKSQGWSNNKIKSIESNDNVFAEETKLPASTRELKGKELEDYLDRIRTQTKLKTDKYKLPYIHRSSVMGYYNEQGKKYNVDAIKEALTERPKSLLKKNEKMKHSDGTDEQFFNVGFAALVGIALDQETNEIIVVNTCPGAGSCKVDCFAMKGGKIQFQGPWLSDGRILTYLLNDPDGFFNQLKNEITKELNKGKKNGYKVSIRWHDAGDFFSPEYAQLAFNMASELPEVDFYAYTKVADVALGKKPDNFIINWSEGASTAQEKKVKASDPSLDITKNSRIVPSNLFYDLLVKDEKKNLVKGPEGQWQVIPDKLPELKQRLAKEYGISANSILSYTEWETKGRKNPAMKWNVIITPGEPDLTAKDPGVLSTLLLKH